MSYCIRTAQPSDIDQLIRIEKSANQAFLAITELAWLAESEVLLAAEHLEIITHQYAFVAINALNQPVGFLYAEKQASDFYILEIDVSSSVQQQGVGRQLLKHAIDIARQHQFKCVTLTTFSDVAWNRPFYEKSGFQLLPEQDLSPTLKDILEQEVMKGFSRDSRCAMRLKLE